MSTLDLCLALNLCVSLASACWAMAALVRPGILSGSTHASTGEIFFVRMYAARAVPLGLAAGLLPVWPGDRSAGWIVLTAALVQLADIAIGVARRQPGMVVGASVGAIVHGLVALAILTQR